MGPELLGGPGRCWIRARALRGPQKRITESVSHRFALPKLTAQIETATGLCEGINPSPKMTRDRARPRPADPGHSRYLPRRHIIAHDQKQSLHRRYHGDYINSGSRLDLDASEKRVPAPRYIRLFSSSPYTAARAPHTRATRPRARHRKTSGGLAALDDHTPDLREAPHAV